MSQIHTRMKKSVLRITLSLSLLIGCTAVSSAAIDIVEIEQQEQVTTLISQTTSNTLHVVNGNGETLLIYNVAGKCVRSFKVEGIDRQYELNLPKGIYIVKVGNTARRITVK